MDRPTTPGAKRFSVDATVHLQFPGEQHPLSAALNNLSEVGLFVVSEITYPASTEFNFRINSEAGNPKTAITGRGRVAWRRQLAAGTHRPPGMGCEILRLTDGSRAALKERLSHNQTAEIDRTPPDRQSLTQEISQQSIQDALATQRVERPEYFRTLSGPHLTQQPPPAKSKVPLWIAAAVLLLTVAAFGLIRSGFLDNLTRPETTVAEQAVAPPTDRASVPIENVQAAAAGDSGTPGPSSRDASSAATPPTRAPSAPASTPRTAGNSGDPTTAAGAASVEDDSGAALADRPRTFPDRTPTDPTQSARRASAPASEQARGEALDLARVWSAAWSAQAVEDYLSFYADDFVSATGLSNRAWQRDRQRKLTSPDFINVTLEEVRFTGTESEGTLRFVQSYRSNSMEDVVTKTLSLRRIGGAWKIVEETSMPLAG